MFPFGSFGAYGNLGFFGNLGLYGTLVPYGSLSLTEASPVQTFAEPLSVDELKRHLGLDQNDSYFDDQLTGFAIAARVQAEIEQNRDLVRKQWDLSLDYWNAFRVELRDPLVSVDLVQYKDSDGNVTTMNADTDYIVDTSKHPGAIAPPYPKMIWPVFVPWPSSSILIRFRSGFLSDATYWSDAGALVKIGMKMLVTGWFEQKIPFVIGSNAAQEYPFGVTSCLRSGAVPRAK